MLVLTITELTDVSILYISEDRITDLFKDDYVESQHLKIGVFILN